MHFIWTEHASVSQLNMSLYTQFIKLSGCTTEEEADQSQDVNQFMS